MNLTIVPIDGAVYVDGLSWAALDLSTCNIPVNVHALQWKNTQGWVEFVDREDGTKPANEPITELPDWALQCKTKWDEAEAAQIAAQKASAEALTAAKDQPTTIGTQPA